jgi:hypothetical protein
LLSLLSSNSQALLRNFSPIQLYSDFEEDKIMEKTMPSRKISSLIWDLDTQLLETTHATFVGLDVRA